MTYDNHLSKYTTFTTTLIIYDNSFNILSYAFYSYASAINTWHDRLLDLSYMSGIEKRVPLSLFVQALRLG